MLFRSGSAISFGAKTAAGTYTVTATNATTSCSSTMSGSVTIYTSPAAYTITSTGSAPYCTSTGTTIRLSGSQASIGYQLYNGATAVGPALAGTGSVISFDAKTAQGTYTVIATNSVNSCSANMTGNITIYTTPTVTLADFSPVCYNTPAFTLTGGAPGTGTYSGSGVSSNNFDPSIAGVGAPTITYTYTSNGCISSASKALTVKTVPSITTSAIPSVCSNATPVSLTPYFSASPTGGSATYVWPNGTGSTLNPTLAGVGNNKTITYTYTGTNSCVSSATNTINILDLPTVTLANFPSVCLNSNAVTLTGGSPGNGTYSGSGVSNGTFNPYNLSTGDHTITYIYSNGTCSNLANATISILNRNKPVAPALTYQSIMCRNASQTMQINNQLSSAIQWYDANNNLLPTTAATYPINSIAQDLTLNVRFSDGTCVSEMTNVNVFVNKVKADFSISPTTVKQGGTATVTNLSTDASAYKWVMSGDGEVEQTLLTTTTVPAFNFNILGTKNIKLVVTGGSCSDSITKTGIITVTATDQSGIVNSKASDVRVYPNPVSEVINVDLTGQNANASIAIYNMVGIKLAEKQIKSANGIEAINVSNLPSGNYLMVVTMNNETLTFKLNKE